MKTTYQSTGTFLPPHFEVSFSSPGSVLQSADRITDLVMHDKKSLLKDKIHELLLLVDEADNPDGITFAIQHVDSEIHSIKDMMNSASKYA